MKSKRTLRRASTTGGLRPVKIEVTMRNGSKMTYVLKRNATYSLSDQRDVVRDRAAERRVGSALKIHKARSTGRLELSANYANSAWLIA